MIMFVLLCYPVSFHMLQLLLTGCPISSFWLSIYRLVSITGNNKSVQSCEIFYDLNGVQSQMVNRSQYPITSSLLNTHQNLQRL